MTRRVGDPAGGAAPVACGDSPGDIFEKGKPGSRA